MTASEFIEWRQRLGLTQWQVAEALGRSTRHIRAYEAGEHPIPRVVQLALVTLECRLAKECSSARVLTEEGSDV